jgi:hypothetical protein
VSASHSRNYHDFAECIRLTQTGHVIDNSNLSIEQTVNAIEAEIKVEIRLRAVRITIPHSSRRRAEKCFFDGRTFGMLTK